jgi:hypothetical protein
MREEGERTAHIFQEGFGEEDEAEREGEQGKLRRAFLTGAEPFSEAAFPAFGEQEVEQG